ncbi:MAG TPA: hypothetical protein VFP78_19535 [Solirubrobacteraceae bacterium]|nr:hypothetical protein [Solirubrobacteraceae bacterium]
MRSAWSPAAVALVALMALGSVVMWLGVPLGLVYVASKLADTPNPTMGPYLLVILGLPVGMAVVGKGLGALNRAHVRLTGAETDDYRPGWTRSMRGERRVDRRNGVLDKVMIVSVAVAGIAFAVWFFGFAGSSLPTG